MRSRPAGSPTSPFPLSALLASLALPLGCTTTPKKTQSHRPNIVVLLVDDLGWRDVGCYGQDIASTPNIDRLASQGMRFLQAYAANPVCSPTRAAFMTGKYPARVNINDWIPGTTFPKARMLPPADLDELPLGETTLAEALRAQGYATWHVGKWHLGGKGFLPQDQGFEVNWMGRDTGHPASHFFPYGNDETGEPVHSHAVYPMPPGGKPGDYLADVQAVTAAELIRGAVGSEKPFFLYLPFYTVHSPIEAKPEDVARHRELRQERIATAPATDREALMQRGPKPPFAAMLENMDHAVGTVLEALEASGLANDTIVVFTSDNGGLAGVSENRPLRGGKRSLWEGGIRIPLLVRWPGVVTPGSTNDLPAITQDVHRALRSAAGADSDAIVSEDAFDLLPVWRGAAPSERRPLYWHFPQHQTAEVGPRGAMRDGDWKLIEDFASDTVMLYDLAHDPNETTDLATQQPRRAQRMREQLRAWRLRVGAKMPTWNPAYESATPPAKPAQ
jgi:arylsulfatase A